IRILDLLPGSGADPIVAELRPMSLDNLEAYEALSYTWGTPDNAVGIELNGYRLEAGPNLFAAMTRFRNPTKTRTLWIDALCINQSSIEERTQQVRLMTLIYSKAAKVLVWLG
ncbi:HET-domain-containing protein, partial [Periconia macrospinosa]